VARGLIPFAAWLAAHTHAADLHVLLRLYPSEPMEVVPVGRSLSNPRNEGPHCPAP
jgi:putative SOS response-associated peptidase YedK